MTDDEMQYAVVQFTRTPLDDGCSLSHCPDSVFGPFTYDEAVAYCDRKNWHANAHIVPIREQA